MKRIFFTLITTISMQALCAQDSTTKKVDTLQVGNYVIIKKGNSNQDSTKAKSVTISSSTEDWLDIKIGNNNNKKKNENVRTDWISFDLGFCNFLDRTNYTQAQQGNYLKTVNGNVVNQNTFNLINGKSSNFNIWFFMQRINIAKHKLNFKWGLGYEMFNYRYENSLSFRNNPANYVFVDSIRFSKNKLYANYITIPLMLNYKADPKKKSALNVSAGVSFGYLIASRNKQISSQRGKEKISGNFDLEPFKVSVIGEIGLGPVRLYTSYSLNNMFKSSTGLDQTPFAFGLRFSKL